MRISYKSTATLCLFYFIATALYAITKVRAWTNTYHKPNPSGGPCIERIESMNEMIVNANLLFQQKQQGQHVLSNETSTRKEEKELVAKSSKRQFLPGLHITALCLGCYRTTQNLCPSEKDDLALPCQNLIDDLYRKCDGVTLPPTYYFDPPENKITGSWDDEVVKRSMKMAAERCGCNSASRLAVFLPKVSLMGIACLLYMLI